MNQVMTPVLSNEEVMPSVHLIWAEAPDIAAAARPGQFVMVRAGEDHDPLLRRPMSIHRVDGKGGMALLAEVVGRGTEWLAERRRGEVLDIFGPLGNGFEVSSQRLLLVAGGCGVAPLAFLADVALAQGREVRLMIGARSADLLYPRRLLPQGIEVSVITEDGSSEKQGMITDLLTEDECRREGEQIIACGRPSMYQAMARLEWLKDRPVQLSLEARMGCGFGGCCGCAIETKSGMKLVCRDGPVFDMSDLLL